MTTELETLKGEITNGCTCLEYDDEVGEYTEEPAKECFGDCWQFAVEDFEMVTKDLRDSNTTGWWKVEDLRLWNREVSGYFRADDVLDIINGMTVRSEWIMRYEVFSDRIEYSLSHHDAMGSASTLRPVPEAEVEEKGLY
jgi:hypothetical protein